MLFNTWTFAIFFTVVYSLYRALPRRGQNALLLVASYFFYGAWDYRFLALLLISTMLDYFCGRAIYRAKDSRQRHLFLVLTVAANLCFLGFFKYCNFFAESLTALLSPFGLAPSLPMLNVVLPVGISFYTFQSMSYTIDIYRGQLKPSTSFFEYATFVAFFPQLVAGPINRAPRLLPQFGRTRIITWEHIRSGSWLIAWGLFKKMVVADNMAPIVNAAFADPSKYQGLDLVLAVNAFAFQVYGDFSGYSDMARGIARLMGFDLMVNFDQPYFAVSPSDFWRRWHISLSTWLRDYLYIPLGGNRGGKAATYRNLMITMLLGGLWHGAAWHFVIWGFYHGLLLSITRPFQWLFDWERSRNPLQRALWRGALVVGMFHLTCLGWLIFRAPDVGTIASFLKIIFSRFTLSPDGSEWLVALLTNCWLLAVIEVWQVISKSEAFVLRQPYVVRLHVWLLVLCSLVFLAAGTGKDFIYFAF